MTATNQQLVAELLHMWLETDRVIKEAQEQKEKIGSELMAQMEPGGEARTSTGAGARMMAPPARFSVELAAAFVPVDLLPQIVKTETSISPDLAKKNLPPELYQKCRRATGSAYLKRL